MGVRGLQTFLKNNPQLSQKLNLSNTSLVIDANNLLCFLYHDLCRGTKSEHLGCDRYGGDFVAYDQIIRNFFQTLDACNITPILVFDGSVIGKQSTKDQLVLKDEQVHRRGLEKFNTARKMFEDDILDDSFIMSSLMSVVFKSIVRDLGVQIIQAPYEADTHLARIANELKIPILTNDSDFIIYPLDVGFIILDLFLYKEVIRGSADKCSIECFIYSQQTLVKYLPGLQPQVMPLLSILLGNDYIAAGTFDGITNRICNVSYYGNLIAKTRSHFKIANLLEWLKRKSIEEAIEYILNFIKSSHRDSLRGEIRILLNNYDIQKTDNFLAELEEIYPKKMAHVNTQPDFMPAAYISRLFESSQLTTTALDIIFHNTNYVYPMVDDFALASSNITVRYRPLSLAVTLLRPRTYEGMTTNRRLNEIERDAHRVCDRLEGEYIIKLVKPMEYLENFGSLEHLTLYSMITLEPALKKQLLFSVFRFNTEEFNLITDTLSTVFREPYIHESRVCLLLVKYIGLETKLSPKPQFVDALMLAFFFYSALNGKLHESLTVNDTRYGQLLLKLRPHSITRNQLSYEPSQTLFRRINHFISQLHTAYTAFNLINTLLGLILQKPRVERFLNGTLIFRLTKLLRMGDMKMEILCEGVPSFLDTCQSIKSILQCAE